MSFTAGIAAVFPLAGIGAQLPPATYEVELSSATVYDTRARDEDTIHAAMAIYVNGERKGTAIWDGKGWDGSRPEGRRWVSGLHVFGSASGSTVRLSTGPVTDNDTVAIAFYVVNAQNAPSLTEQEAVADRVHRARCDAPEGGSAWDCLAAQGRGILGDWPLSACDGMVAADNMAFAGVRLRKQTESGGNVTANHRYRGTAAPPGCSGGSIYAVMVAVKRR